MRQLNSRLHTSSCRKQICHVQMYPGPFLQRFPLYVVDIRQFKKCDSEYFACNKKRYQFLYFYRLFRIRRTEKQPYINNFLCLRQKPNKSNIFSMYYISKKSRKFDFKSCRDKHLRIKITRILSRSNQKCSVTIYFMHLDNELILYLES